MRSVQLVLLAMALSTLSACSSIVGTQNSDAVSSIPSSEISSVSERNTTIWDALSTNIATTPVKVNRYIWQASLEVLDFMPIEYVDPFSGIIVMGFGTPPGGSTAYRATVHVSEPALDARALRIALATRSGPASAETMRALEDAILSRARQIRRDDGLL